MPSPPAVGVGSGNSDDDGDDGDDGGDGERSTLRRGDGIPFPSTARFVFLVLVWRVKFRVPLTPHALVF